MSGRGSQRLVALATTTALLLVAMQVLAKSTRDALFLDALGAVHLPAAMLGASLISLGLTLVTSRAMGNTSPARVARSLLVASALLFGLETALVRPWPKACASLLYLHVTVIGAVATSAFWSVVNERFDPHAGKRAIARATAGATAGGVLGGLLAVQFATRLPVGLVLTGLAGLAAATAILLSRLGRDDHSRAVADSGPTSTDAMWSVRHDPLLRRAGWLVALTATLGALVDYCLKFEVDRAYGSRDDLLSFFGVFYTATGVLAFGMQSGLARTLLTRVGIAATACSLPIATAGGAILAMMSPTLWPMVVLAAAEESLSNSLFRSGYESLYTPVPPHRKRAAKVVVDVGIKRLGSALGSGLVWLSLWLVTTPILALLAGVLVSSALSLVLLWRLRTDYMRALTESLREGTLDLPGSPQLDATTLRTLTESTGALSRAELLAQISAMRDEGDGGAPSRERAADALEGDNLQEARRVLRRRPFPIELAPAAIRRLDQPELAREAFRALASIARPAEKALLEAVHSTTTSAATRRRLVRLLATVGTHRASRAVRDALYDPDQRVRTAAAVAAGRNHLHIEQREVTNLLRRELPRQPLDRSAALRFAFALLGAAHNDPDTMRLCSVALSQGDDGLAGTALEYLESRLPDEQRELLWPHLTAVATTPRVGRRARRPAEQSLQLLRSSVDLMRKAQKAASDEEDVDAT